MKLPCAKCGKLEPRWCNRLDCPLFPKAHIPAKESFSGVTPNLFIGRYNYPDVRAGFLATEDGSGSDDPKAWTERQTPIAEIIRSRTTLINSTFAANTKRFPERYDEMRQLVAQSEKPVAADVDLAKRPVFTVQYPTGTTPHGPSVALRDAQLTENVHVPSDVDKTLNDDLLATAQLGVLSRKHDEYYLQKLLSAGLLGHDKKLVPTRWSITAVDDTLGKQHLEQIRQLPELSEPVVHVGGHYGNFYVILFLPGRWQYELFELYVGSRAVEDAVWTDYEPFAGRRTYAQDTVGGYYAARLNITRHALEQKRQSAVLAFRFVTDEYTNPLGVWVVREAVRLCLEGKPLRFSSEDLAVQFAVAYARKHHGFDLTPFVQRSRLLASRAQRTLGSYDA